MQFNLIRFVSLLCLFSVWTIGLGQQQTADDYFKAARDAAFKNKNYPEAIGLLYQSLQLNPEYTEVRLFLANVYRWSDLPDSARITLLQIPTYSPGDSQALSALAELEYQQKKFNQSIAYCDEGIKVHPLLQHFKLIKAKNLVELNQHKGALHLCNDVLAAEPGNREANMLYKKIRTSNAKNAFGIRYDHTWFDKQFADPWTITSVQYSRQTKAGSIIGRVNFGSRYGDKGMQAEIDAYPRISKRLYAYVSGGYSPDEPVFPTFRGGFSLYANLPKAFEAEAGVRYLNFGNDTWIYTVSAGKYLGNFWFNLRAYITPDQSRISHSYAATARYYLKDVDNYLMFSTSTGISPDDRVANAQLNADYKLASKGLSAGYQFTVSTLNLLSFYVSYSNIEYQPKINGNQVSAGVHFQRRF